MGYAVVMGPCVGCGRIFSFNPNRVPSIFVDGVREPVCRTCVERANETRKTSGLPLFTVHADSYEPVDEREL